MSARRATHAGSWYTDSGKSILRGSDERKRSKISLFRLDGSLEITRSRWGHEVKGHVQDGSPSYCLFHHYLKSEAKNQWISLLCGKREGCQRGWKEWGKWAITSNTNFPFLCLFVGGKFPNSGGQEWLICLFPWPHMHISSSYFLLYFCVWGLIKWDLVYLHVREMEVNKGTSVILCVFPFRTRL